MISWRSWRNERLLVAALAFGVLLASAACANGGGGIAKSGPEGKEWRLVELDTGPVAAAEGPRASSLRLDAENAQASGSGGCNRFSGGYTLTGDALTFQPLAATKMACPEMATESAYFAALAQTRAWRIHRGRLELLDGDGAVVAIFAAAPAP